MAIYHFSAKIVSRSNGSSAVAAAAYRAAERLQDERRGRAHDFTSKAGVIHSEVILPEGAPERWSDRQSLWNEVEAGEKRKDAQLAREVEVSIPREMSREDGVRRVRDFVSREVVAHGMVADLNVHWDYALDGSPKPHAHVMLSMREITPGEDDGGAFGPKVRDWNSTELLQGWREGWATHVNERLVELGIEASIDHRSLEDQGINLEPQHKIGPAGMRREERGEEAERAVEHRDIARRNGDKIIAEPRVALDALTRQQSTFTDHDLARFVHRHTDDAEQFTQAVSAVRTSSELVALGVDGRGRERFSTREMVDTERRLERSAVIVFERDKHRVSAASLNRGLAAAEQSGLQLGEEQRLSLEHITGSGGLSLVVGYAGTGKSAMLGAAREVWERSGYQVRGAALSGIAAESLEAGSGIGSRTLASFEHAWGQGREELTSRDVLVIDEAGMVGSRQMERVLCAIERAGAKVVMVGDPEQLQAIEAGAAFRALSERHGAAEITEVRRQREDWQRDATRELATGRTSNALDRYESAGMVVAHADRAGAREAVVAGWNVARIGEPGRSQVILAHTRADVAELNQLARERMREAGMLGHEVAIVTERGTRAFATGDRIMFLRNERSLGVKNGTLAEVAAVTPSNMSVRLDDGREVSFDVRDYGDVDHGYAATIHKAQGVTVDRAHVLATPGLDRHGAYVAMTRHREGLSLHYGGDDFEDRQALTRTLGRERAKDTTLDYGQDSLGRDYGRTFAERRNIHVPSELEGPIERSRSPEVERRVDRRARLKLGRERVSGLTPTSERPVQAGRFDGLKLRARPAPAPPTSGEPIIGRGTPPEFEAALERFGRAYVDAARMAPQGYDVLEHQKTALRDAGRALDQVRPNGAEDLFEAIKRDPSLLIAAREGRTSALVGALKQEAEVRASPELRADRFVGDWRAMKAEHARLGRGGEQGGPRKALEARMGEFAGGLKRDPQLESVLTRRDKELGISMKRSVESDLGQALLRSLSKGRTLGMGR